MERKRQCTSLCTSTIESAVYENRTYSAVRGRRLVTASYSIMYHGLSKMCKIDSLQRTGLNVVLEGLVEIFSSAGKNDYNNFFSLTIERVSQFIIGFIVI